MFLTTHYMDEAQYLANRVAVIAHGTIVAEGPPGSLAGRERMQDADPVPPADRELPNPTALRHRSPDGSYEILADQEETTKVVHDLTGVGPRVAASSWTRSRSRLRPWRTSTSS